jgi:hypothetical protein
MIRPLSWVQELRSRRYRRSEERRRESNFRCGRRLFCEPLEDRRLLSLGSGDDSLQTAQDLGNLQGQITVSDFVGTTDPVDYFKFTVTSPVREVTVGGKVEWTDVSS